jgi:hypothetical protein
MHLWIPGTYGREYATALAPETKEAPSPYEKSPTPILVIRQRGEAWERPFAVIYEPRSAATTGDTDGIQSVTALASTGRFAGFKITSRLAGRTTTQLVITLTAADSEFSDAALDLTFRGRYAVVTLDDRDSVAALYLGEGTSLRFRGHTLTTPSAAFADLASSVPSLTSAARAALALPDGRQITSSAP